MHELRTILDYATNVFRVHRDLIEDIRTELQEQKEEWADDITARVVEEVKQDFISRVMEAVEPDRI